MNTEMPCLPVITDSKGVMRYGKAPNLRAYFAEKLGAPKVSQSPMERCVRTMVSFAQKNAKKREIVWTINAEHVFSILKKQNGVCAVSGIEFEIDHAPGQKRRPFAPSLDRIDSKRGYVRGNVRVVCVIANLAMNEWGHDALFKLASAVVALKTAR
jgi:hypothetical protein